MQRYDSDLSGLRFCAELLFYVFRCFTTCCLKLRCRMVWYSSFRGHDANDSNVAVFHIQEVRVATRVMLQVPLATRVML